MLAEDIAELFKETISERWGQGDSLEDYLQGWRGPEAIRAVGANYGLYLQTIIMILVDWQMAPGTFMVYDDDPAKGGKPVPLRNLFSSDPMLTGGHGWNGKHSSWRFLHTRIAPDRLQLASHVRPSQAI